MIVEYEVRNAVAHITLNRPEANSVDMALARELMEVATTADEDPAVRAVVLTGKGRFFCAGGDLKSMLAGGDKVGSFVKTLATMIHAAMSRLARMDKPVLCAVNGTAAGAGMSLAISGDLVVAARSATFSMAYTAAGLSPDGAGTWLLPRLVGLRRAQELIFTNRRLTAEQALDWGLVTQVVDDAEFPAAIETLAQQLAAGPTRAFGQVKQLLLEAYGSFETQTEREGRGVAAMVQTPDGQEGIRAFSERRKPRFTGL